MAVQTLKRGSAEPYIYKLLISGLERAETLAALCYLFVII